MAIESVPAGGRSNNSRGEGSLQHVAVRAGEQIGCGDAELAAELMNLSVAGRVADRVVEHRFEFQETAGAFRPRRDESARFDRDKFGGSCGSLRECPAPRTARSATDAVRRPERADSRSLSPPLGPSARSRSVGRHGPISRNFNRPRGQWKYVSICRCVSELAGA